MSARLARIAARVARKKARGFHVSEMIVLERAPPTTDPWGPLLDGPRLSVVEVLADGTVSETFIDTVAGLRAAATPAPAAPPLPPPSPTFLPPPPPGPLRRPRDPWRRLQ